MRRLFALALVAAGLTAAPTPAAVIMSFQEVGGGVTATATGTLNTTGLSVLPGTSSGAGVLPSNNFVLLQNPSAVNILSNIYTIVNTNPPFGSGGFTLASTGGGGPFGFSNSSGLLNVFAPRNYVSGSPLFGTMTFDGATFASLGLTPGTYTYAFNSGANADTITLRIGPAQTADPVPEPATLAVFAGLAAVGGLVARRRRTAHS